MKRKQGKHSRGISPLEALLLLCIAALAVATIYPSMVKVRDAVLVETAARELDHSTLAINDIVKTQSPVTNATEITLDMISDVLYESGRRQLAWPPEVDLSTFSVDASNAPSVSVRLKSGLRTVTLDDITSQL